MYFRFFLEDILQKENEIVEILIECLKNMDVIILLAIIKQIFYYSALLTIIHTLPILTPVSTRLNNPSI